MYQYLQKCINIYHRVKSLFVYRPFLKDAAGSFIIRNPIAISPSCISMGKRVHIRDNSRIEGVQQYEGILYTPAIVIGDHVSIEQNFHLTCASSIFIGNNTAIAANVTITDIDHTYTNINLPPERQPLKVIPVNIGEDCKIYNNVVILPGAVLGKHTVVAANSVVPGKEFPAFSVLAGAPARVVKYYDLHSKQWLKATDKQ